MDQHPRPDTQVENPGPRAQTHDLGSVTNIWVLYYTLFEHFMHE